VGCPFVVRIWATNQDDKNLYMMLDYCSGGELEYQLVAQPGRKIPEEAAKFYCAEIALALEQMHNKHNIVHRDLKPENVLLDGQGHVALIDFNIGERCDSNLFVANPKGHHVGTLPYTSPELLRGLDHSHLVDWWSLGIMLYEMTHGVVPFRQKSSEKKEKLTASVQVKLIEATNIQTITNGSEAFKEVVRNLLAVKPTERWCFTQLKASKWLCDIDWDVVRNKGLKPPIIPVKDKVNFNQDLQMEESLGMTKTKDRGVLPEEQHHFQSWDWVDRNQDLPTKYQYIEKKSKKKGKHHHLKAHAHSPTGNSDHPSNPVTHSPSPVASPVISNCPSEEDRRDSKDHKDSHKDKDHKDKDHKDKDKGDRDNKGEKDHHKEKQSDGHSTHRDKGTTIRDSGHHHHKGDHTPKDGQLSPKGDHKSEKSGDKSPPGSGGPSSRRTSEAGGHGRKHQKGSGKPTEAQKTSS